mmetsp:Transcript_1474/g.4868  ORF Transcript_1474/g.4868 Transcript_1474/m.4868 type:complete len:272 (+) Transcript_1474:780-1595(+)
MTGMPSSSLSWRKKGIVDQASGMRRFVTSTGMASTYSSATTSRPSLSTRAATPPSSFTRISARGASVSTSPPASRMRSAMGAHTRSGWLPSRNAVCEPSASLMKRFIAVSTTVMDSLSGSMKSSAFPMAMKISSLIVSGMPYFSMNWSTLNSSCSSMKLWPSRSMGSRPGTMRILSTSDSISVFVRMAAAMFSGAGTPSGNSKLVNSPGRSRIAKDMRWAFHWSRSRMSNSLKRLSTFGYAPKKTCNPVSIQSPSSSCHALTLPPSTSRAS